MTKFDIETTEEWCGECVVRAINCDPQNMGWTEEQDNDWTEKFEEHFSELVGVVITTPADDPVEAHSSKNGCELCWGLATDVYTVVVLAYREPEPAV